MMGAGGRGVGRPGGGAPGDGARPGGDVGGDRGAPAVASGGGATDGGSSDDVRSRVQQLRAQVQEGTITQDSMRAAMVALRESGALEEGGLPGAPGGAMNDATQRETRPAAVFVMNAQGVPELRRVQIGINDWDYTQVVSGVEEGETLAVVGAAQLQAQQQEFLDRIRSRSGGPFGGGPGRGR
jgi:hypothetical protein